MPIRTPIALAVLIALAAPSASFAVPFRGIQPVAQAAELNAVTVTGHSDMKVKPDIAYTTLQIVTQDKDQTVAVADNATRAQAVIETVKKSLVEDRDIQTDSYTVQPVYDYRPSPAVLTGYQVTNSIRVTIRNISKAGLIVDKATTAGANAVGGISFDLADRSKAEGLALVEAVRSARAKADLIAGAAGIGLGRVLSVTEGTAPTVQPVMFMQRAVAMAPEAAPTTPVMSQDITVSADVTVSFAIDYAAH